jgi:Tol biopolymer transport system component
MSARHHRRRTALAVALAGCGALALAPAFASAHTRSTLVWWTPTGPTTSYLMIADGDGRHARPLTDPGGMVGDIEPVISPDGRSVLFERDLADGRVQIVLKDVLRGSERVIDTGCVDPCAGDLQPGWVPDGRRITFTRVRFDAPTQTFVSALLFSADLHGRNVRRLSEIGIDSTYEEQGARFAPDGRSAVVQRTRTADSQIAVFRLHFNGRPATQLTEWSLGADQADYSPAAHGPTRDLVVFDTNDFVGGAGPFSDIAVLPAACSPLPRCTAATRLLTHNAAGSHAFGPTWTQDGRSVVFLQFGEGEAGQADLWKVNADGTHRRRLTDTPDIEISPDSGPAALR